MQFEGGYGSPNKTLNEVTGRSLTIIANSPKCNEKFIFLIK